jgi:TetR/AcrR family acrAB operon transcriptional repressor
MVRKTREEAMLTREQLLDAAEHVFRARGVGHASLAEVADAAGVTRGAVYWHFQSKAALFQAMVERAEMSHDASLRKMAADADADPLAALRAALVESLRRVATDDRTRRVYDVVFLRCEYTDDLASVREQTLRSRRYCYEQIERTLGAAVARGQLPAHLDIDCATRGLYAYIGGLMRDSLELPAQIDLARNAEALVDTYLRGLQHAPAALARSGTAGHAARPATPRATAPAATSAARKPAPESARQPARARPAATTRTRAAVRTR